MFYILQYDNGRSYSIIKRQCDNDASDNYSKNKLFHATIFILFSQFNRRIFVNPLHPEIFYSYFFGT